LTPPIALATLPLLAVVCVNLVMSIFVLPHLNVSYLAEQRWGSTSLAAVGGVWAVVVALAAAIVTPLLRRRTGVLPLAEPARSQ
jgi:hypothetical protein